MKILRNIQYLFSHLSSQMKIKFFFIIFLTILSSFFEFLGLSSIIPFISVLSDPGYLFENNYFQFFNQYLGFSNETAIVLPMTCLFILIILLTGLFRILLTYFTINYAESISAEINILIFQKSLNRSYKDFLTTPSGNIISLMTQKIFETSLLIFGIFQGFTAFILTITITIAMLIFSFELSFIVISFFSFIFILALFQSNPKLKKNSLIITNQQNSAVSKIQDSLGVMRDIILNNNQNYFIKNYQNIILSLKTAVVFNNFLSKSPRFIIETLGICFIAALSYYMIFIAKNNIDTLITGLAIIGLGSSRLFPLLNQMYFTWSTIVGYSESLFAISNFLKSKNRNTDAITNDIAIRFNQTLQLKEISYQHPNSKKPLFTNFNLTIQKNSLVGIVGESGVGKSTLMDLLMYLIKPDEGLLLIDDKTIDEQNYQSWQQKISIVPQQTFLIQDTFAKNIALGMDEKEISMPKLIEAAKKASIYDFILSKEGGFNYQIQETGLNLSGGQIQRLGLARAFYKDSEIIFLDEVTSSLDKQTEKAILNEIINLKKQNLTIVFTTHNASLLKEFDTIINLNNRKIIPN